MVNYPLWCVGIAFAVIVAALTVIAACMLHSRISRMENPND